MGIDKWAQRSRLADISPGLKLAVCLYWLINCIASDSVVVSSLTLISSALVVCVFGGLKPEFFLRCLRIPMAFVFIASAALIIEPADGNSLITVLGLGISADSLLYALNTFFRCMGAAGALFMLSLTTPAYDIFGVLQKLRLPDDITETAKLIYRYIFVLYDSYVAIKTAQEARLGYSSLKTGYRSFSLLGAAIFSRAVNQARRSFSAMESRNYTGSVKTSKKHYTLTPIHIVSSVLFCIILTAAGVIF